MVKHFAIDLGAFLLSIGELFLLFYLVFSQQILIAVLYYLILMAATGSYSYAIHPYLGLTFLDSMPKEEAEYLRYKTAVITGIIWPIYPIYTILNCLGLFSIQITEVGSDDDPPPSD